MSTLFSPQALSGPSIQIRRGFLTGPVPSAAEINQVQTLFNQETFWAQGRDSDQLRKSLLGSDVVVTAWFEAELIGLARALSDGVYRATIWDVVVAADYRGLGIGKKLIKTLLTMPELQVERIYLMTTHHQAFYHRLGFQPNSSTTMVMFSPGSLSNLPT